MHPAAAIARLTEVCAALVTRGHDATMDGRRLYVGELAATAKDDGKILVRAVTIPDKSRLGFRVAMPESTVTPDGPHATVEKLVAAIEKRLRARATSLPLPVDPGAIVHDP